MIQKTINLEIDMRKSFKAIAPFLLVMAIIAPMSSQARIRDYAVKKTNLYPEILVRIDNFAPKCWIKFVDKFAEYKVVEATKDTLFYVTVQEVKLLSDVSVGETKSSLLATVTVSGTRDLVIAAAACPSVRK